MAPEKWKTQSSREVYRNPWIHVREDIAELPDGRTTIYGVVTMSGAVGVLPFVDADHVMLVRQYRYVFDELDRWEMPTGGIKPGEAAEDAAQRELQEEIGHTAARLEWLSTFYTSNSVCHEVAYLYVGYDLAQSALPQDDTEDFELAIFPFDQVLEMVYSSEIRDSMTVVAVLHAARLRAQQQK